MQMETAKTLAFYYLAFLGAVDMTRWVLQRITRWMDESTKRRNKGRD